MDELRNYIQTITDFSENSWEILGASMTHLALKKGEYLLQIGERCESVFFIQKGYCRAFYNQDGEEINAAFYFEKDFATNIKSLTANSLSDYAIQACEPLEVIRFNKEKLLNAYQQSHEIEAFGRKMLAFILAKQESHTDLFKLLTAQQRYEHIQKNHPEMLQRVSLTQISSYLGVSRETLSRIRGRKK